MREGAPAVGLREAGGDFVRGDPDAVSAPPGLQKQPVRSEILAAAAPEKLD